MMMMILMFDNELRYQTMMGDDDEDAYQTMMGDDDSI